MAVEVLQHVLFDGEPDVILHVCAAHKQVADTLPCTDERTDGGCAHVQYRVCECPEPQACAVCLDPV